MLESLLELESLLVLVKIQAHLTTITAQKSAKPLVLVLVEISSTLGSEYYTTGALQQWTLVVLLELLVRGQLHILLLNSNSSG